jgi:hypothetical protein
MKSLLCILSAIALVAAFTVPAMAQDYNDLICADDKATVANDGGTAMDDLTVKVKTDDVAACNDGGVIQGPGEIDNSFEDESIDVSGLNDNNLAKAKDDGISANESCVDQDNSDNSSQDNYSDNAKAKDDGIAANDSCVDQDNSDNSDNSQDNDDYSDKVKAKDQGIAANDSCVDQDNSDNSDNSTNDDSCTIKDNSVVCAELVQVATGAPLSISVSGGIAGEEGGDADTCARICLKNHAEVDEVGNNFAGISNVMTNAGSGNIAGGQVTIGFTLSGSLAGPLTD